ncbi:MAG: biopolymer transporter ExbD [Dysgonamonadaceae bacterium]|jgi:biopolymer transport protein ExbD|nr:biopolymer transporter ExbD [Dysgonamonadaceae bacterium]
MRYRKKRKIPALNASSMADIAFLLLIFFLVTGSFGADTGIYRNMPPFHSQPDTLKKEIEKSQLLHLTLDDQNQLLLKDEIVPLNEVNHRVQQFLLPPDSIDLRYISLEISRSANYQTYITLLSEISAAYRELSNRQKTAYSIHLTEEELVTEKEGGRP